MDSFIYSALCLAYFGRMDGDKHFKCALTQVAPGLKSSWPLHPWVRVFIKPLIPPPSIELLEPAKTYYYGKGMR